MVYFHGSMALADDRLKIISSSFFSFPRSTAILRNSTTSVDSTATMVAVAVAVEEEEAFLVDCCLLFSLLV